MLAETTPKPLIATAKRELADTELAQITQITVLWIKIPFSNRLWGRVGGCELVSDGRNCGVAEPKDRQSSSHFDSKQMDC